MSRPSVIIGLSLVLAALFAAAAYFTEGFWQATLIGSATVFLTLAVTEALTGYREQLEKPIFYVTLLTIAIAALIGTTLYLGYSLLSLTKVEPFRQAPMA